MYDIYSGNKDICQQIYKKKLNYSFFYLIDFLRWLTSADNICKIDITMSDNMSDSYYSNRYS